MSIISPMLWFILGSMVMAIAAFLTVFRRASLVYTAIGNDEHPNLPPPECPPKKEASGEMQLGRWIAMMAILLVAVMQGGGGYALEVAAFIVALIWAPSIIKGWMSSRVSLDRYTERASVVLGWSAALLVVPAVQILQVLM